MIPPGPLVAMIVPVSLFALVFGIIYLKSRENMALIERGINPKQHKSQPQPFVNLKYGLLFSGSGLGLLLAYIIDNLMLGHKVVVTGMSINSTDSDNPAIYFALIAIGGGLGLVLSYFIEKKQWLDNGREQAD